VQCFHGPRELLEVDGCESVAKVRSGFDELGDYDRPTADRVKDPSAPAASGRQDELVPGVAKLASSLVVRREMALSVSTNTDPPGAGSVTPAVTAGRNECRGLIARIELNREKVGERSDIDRRIG